MIIIINIVIIPYIVFDKSNLVHFSSKNYPRTCSRNQNVINYKM